MYTLVESRVKGLGCEQEMMEIFEALAIVRTFFTYPSGIPELFKHLSDSCSLQDTHDHKILQNLLRFCNVIRLTCDVALLLPLFNQGINEIYNDK